jgi:hypothetical protein
MAIEGMTDAEVALLTPEERTALEDPTPDAAQADDAAKKAALADDAGDDDDGDAETGGAEPARAADPAGQAAASDVALPAAKADEPKERVFLPTLPTGDARNFDEEEAALVKKYEEGELDEANYRRGLREIYTAQSAAENASKFNEEVQKQVWENEVGKFIRVNQQYKPGTVLYSALGRALELEGAAEGADNLAGDELLARAHKRVMAEFGINPAAGAGNPALTAPKRPGEAAARSSAPITLGEVPAADLPDVGGSKYAHLDKLDGLAFENALAKLPPAEQEAYLANKV